MTIEVWQQQFGEVMQRGVQNGIPLPHMIVTLSLSKTELSNAHLAMMRQAEIQKTASKIVGPGGN